MRDLDIDLAVPLWACDSYLSRKDGLRAVWLYEKAYRTGSARAFKAVETLLAAFLQFHTAQAFDLDTYSQDVTFDTQSWAASPVGSAGRNPGAAYQNRRLPAASDFYDYFIRHDFLPSPIHDNRSAVLPDKELLRQRLAAPNRSSPEGRCDHVIFAVARPTGQRLGDIDPLGSRHQRIVEVDSPQIDRITADLGLE